MVADSDEDDLSIRNEEKLFRRIRNVETVWDDNLNQMRPTSQAFQNHPDNPRAFSVNLESVLQDRGLAIESLLVDESSYSLVTFSAQLARNLGQKVHRQPQDGDPSHAHVVGDKGKSVRREFSKAAEWAIPPKRS